MANAVNGNNSTSGDFVLRPVSLQLVPAPVIADSTTNLDGISDPSASIQHFMVYPNPATEINQARYVLTRPQLISIELLDLQGALVKRVHEKEEVPGEHRLNFNLQTVPSGVYFIRISANKKTSSQKLLIIP